MKQYQLVLITLFTTSLCVNAMQEQQTAQPQKQESAPIAIPGNHSHGKQLLNNEEEVFSKSTPALTTAAAMLSMSGDNLDNVDKEGTPKSPLSDVYKTMAYSHSGSWQGDYCSTKSQGENRHNRKNQYKQKDREKNSKNK